MHSHSTRSDNMTDFGAHRVAPSTTDGPGQDCICDCIHIQLIITGALELQSLFRSNIKSSA